MKFFAQHLQVFLNFFLVVCHRSLVERVFDCKVLFIPVESQIQSCFFDWVRILNNSIVMLRLDIGRVKECFYHLSTWAILWLRNHIWPASCSAWLSSLASTVFTCVLYVALQIISQLVPNPCSSLFDHLTVHKWEELVSLILFECGLKLFTQILLIDHSLILTIYSFLHVLCSQLSLLFFQPLKVLNLLEKFLVCFWLHFSWSLCFMHFFSNLGQMSVH